MVQAFVKRPTSPLHFEPLEPKASDILWPGSEDEADEDKREKKRLRVEILGKQYLEGKPLFIQSAGLRGPFDDGWVNPWARRSETGIANVRAYRSSRVTDEATDQRFEHDGAQVAAKRRSIADTDITFPRINAVGEHQEEPHTKRRRHEQIHQPSGFSVADSRPPTAIDLREDQRNTWLKRDKGLLHSRTRSDRASPTPTPTAKPHAQRPETSRGMQLRLFREEAAPTASEIGGPYLPASSIESNHVYSHNQRQNGAAHKQANRSKEKHMGKSDNRNNLDENSQNFDAAKQSTEQAISLHETLFKAKQPHLVSHSPQTRSPGVETPTRSRLAPYVSEIIHTEGASSAGLKAASKPAKPSPRAAPPTTHLQTFQYRYTGKLSTSPSAKGKPRPIETRMKPQVRERSSSTSSSGSSEFAEAFEAAQAKAASGSLGNGPPSPMRPRPETRSVKKNTQAMRRLTFTSSGEPKLAGSRGASRPSSSSSAAPAHNPRRNHRDTKTKRSDGNARNQKGSAKSSSAQSLTNGVHTRESHTLPEAQVISDGPVKLPQGPSTDQMETDKQSLKFLSLEEEDSYLNLSTQAAVAKAQRAFKDELSPFKVSPQKIQENVLRSARSARDEGLTTPIANGHRKRDTEQNLVKTEPTDEAEPMSTQDLVNAISPFTVTTVKKQPPPHHNRASFAPSPFKNKSQSPPLFVTPDPPPTFRKPLSMATTPSHSQPNPSSPPIPISQPNPSSPPVPLSNPKTISKPPSSMTSFSMLPNGTISSESNLQNGQQQQLQQADYDDISLPLSDLFGTPFASARSEKEKKGEGGSYDLSAAIEEAGSFLGHWDVEVEARRGAKNGSAPRGILSGRRRAS
ncbi:hypothetical protein ACLMJK_003694 [Lecanora helva]